MKFVVGTDGSAQAALAVRWSADEAEVNGAELVVVLVWSYLDQYHPDRSDAFDTAYSEDTARAALAAWVSEELGPHAAVQQRVVNDLPVTGLLEVGDAADLLVLGSRGRGGFEGLVLGSVSERVAQLATSPVAVVRSPAAVRGGRVVAGIDGSARSQTALHWAAAEARARNAPLDVVHAWRPPLLSPFPVGSTASDHAALEAAGRTVLDAAVHDPALAGTDVRAHLSHDRPARALIERAAGAGLVVVGTRGLGRVAGTLLGSVSRQLLHHAPCPIVVI
jgi:nucleotide-binding universal stress UspA family protein